MAKSLRSKWRKKCRAVKRVRYGEKELAMLKKTVANDPLHKPSPLSEVQDVISNVEEIANVVSAAQIAASKRTEAEAMDIDGLKKEFNPKTLRDKNDAFPIWLHPRKFKAGKKNKKHGNNKGKKSVKRINKK